MAVEFHAIHDGTMLPYFRTGVAMNDEAAIANLVFRYAELIDGGDYDGIGALFADAVITADGSDVEWRGAEAITAMYVNGTRRYEDGTPRSKHVTSNLIIDVDDARARATCRSYYTVFQQTDEVPLQPIVSRSLPRRVRPHRRRVALHAPQDVRRPRRRPLQTPVVRVPPPRFDNEPASVRLVYERHASC